MRVTKKQLEQALLEMETELNFVWNEKEKIRNFLKDLFLICESCGISLHEVYGHPHNEGKYDELIYYILEQDIEEYYGEE